MIHAEKQRLRAQMRELSVCRPPGNSISLSQRVQGLDSWKQAGSVLLYSPLPGEPDPTLLIRACESRRYLFPRIDGKLLRVYRKGAESRWVTGSFGLLEPDPGSWEECSPADVDLALVPGLAFDRSGRRLGRGKGYYDRLLGHPEFKAVKIGLAWPWQLLPCIPSEGHDVRMDLVITE